MRKIVFNPLSGKFDYIDVVDTSLFAQATPVTLLDGEVWIIGDNKQGNYITEIDIESGGEIALGDNAEIVQGVAA